MSSPEPVTRCQCACCHKGVGEEDLQIDCPADMTQEDMLCDYCRKCKADCELPHCHLFGPGGVLERRYARD